MRDSIIAWEEDSRIEGSHDCIEYKCEPRE
jgi:hypothetical protein